MIPLILGAHGGMGRRYQAILYHLNVTYWTQDIDHEPSSPVYEAPPWDSVIIATPTATHTALIHHYAEYGVPILCEKPITKNMTELMALVDTFDKNYTAQLQMVNQYEHLAPCQDGITFYDYFKSGSDGLYWDTISIGALARGAFSAWNRSPIWQCTINGRPLNLSDMDGAYIAMMRQWLHAPRHDLDYIVTAHEKAAARTREAGLE